MKVALPGGRMVVVLAVGVLTGSLLAVGGMAVASSDSDVGLIRTCVRESSGKIRVVEAKEKCRSREYPLTWNNQGPQGAQGAPGPAGHTRAFNANVANAMPVPDDGADLIGLQLPKGRFVVTGTVSLQNTDASEPSLVACSISSPTGSHSSAPALTQLPAGYFGQVTKTGFVVLTSPAEIRMNCSLGSQVHGDTQRVSADLTAVEVHEMSVETSGSSPVPV